MNEIEQTLRKKANSLSSGFTDTIKFSLKKIIIIAFISIIIMSSTILIPLPNNVSNAVIASSEITGQEYYIKNMYTGQYLDVAGGVAANGTNVQQYKWNGTDAQRWYIKDNGDGTFSFYTRLGNNGVYRYALDIENGANINNANAQIYTINNTNAQKFKIYESQYFSFVFMTQCSNNTKALVLSGPTFNEGGNVNQYTFQNYQNEMWLLEPVSKNITLGVAYAKANVHNYVSCYPDMRLMKGDCANFVSQCLLAQGVHYQGDWRVYRNNANYSKPASITQLDNTWDLCAPRTSPWVSAIEFGNFWKPRTVYGYATGTYILNNPELIFGQLGIGRGNVIQQAKSNWLGGLGDSEHTLYITGYGVYKGEATFIMTYHSNEEEGKALLQICEQEPNAYYIFYRGF